LSRSLGAGSSSVVPTSVHIFDGIIHSGMPPCQFVFGKQYQELTMRPNRSTVSFILTRGAFLFCVLRFPSILIFTSHSRDSTQFGQKLSTSLIKNTILL
jgi:hypothetical protein